VSEVAPKSSGLSFVNSGKLSFLLLID